LRIIEENDPRFRIGPSTVPGAGSGLFANVALAVGDRLLVIGVLIDPGSVADKCTRYADVYKLRVEGRLLIPLGFAALVNHSDRPNLEKDVAGESVYLRAVRPIAAGEELFLRYSEYALERFGIRE
jgi:hypothetical protein